MEEKKKCSSKKHKNIDALIYCHNCKSYFCNKCEIFHSDIFESHKTYKIEEIQNILFEYCKENNHFNVLDYFCKNHNQLCCISCISKIKGKGNGQHSDCDICFVEEINAEKKNKLKNNIEKLENISHDLEESINKFNEVLEKTLEEKEKLKLKIQNIFTKIRNEINNQEDKILSKIDKYYENLYFRNDLIKQGEKLPNQVKNTIETGKYLNKEWKENQNIRFFISC